MEPLFNPQVGCVGVADTESGDEGLRVTLAVPVQPLAVCVTVTVYVPGATLVGFWPLRPPVHAYVYPAGPGETLMEPLFNPQVGSVGVADTESGVEALMVTLVVPVQPLAV
jgi:hypothetical protein